MSSETDELGLPPRLSALFKSLDGKGDVPVGALYLVMFGESEKTEREQAQRLGTYISRLNDKLEEYGLIVEPGRTKYSYALNPII